MGELKNCIEDGLDKFFKSNLCCYNNLEINNILMINIHLSFFTKTLKMWKISLFFP